MRVRVLRKDVKVPIYREKTPDGDVIYTSNGGRRAAIFTPHEGRVTFGSIRMAADGGTWEEFIVSPSRSSRTYKGERTAENAAVAWIASEKRDGAASGRKVTKVYSPTAAFQVWSMFASDISPRKSGTFAWMREAREFAESTSSRLGGAWWVTRIGDDVEHGAYFSGKEYPTSALARLALNRVGRNSGSKHMASASVVRRRMKRQAGNLSGTFKGKMKFKFKGTFSDDAPPNVEFEPVESEVEAMTDDGRVIDVYPESVVEGDIIDVEPEAVYEGAAYGRRKVKAKARGRAR